MTELDPRGVSAAAKALAVAQRQAYSDAVVAAGGDPLPVDPDSALEVYGNALAQAGTAVAAYLAVVGPPADEDAIRLDERERLSARVYENGWCPTCAASAAASPADERLREALEALSHIYVMLAGGEPMWADMPVDERCARAANEAQQAFLRADALAGVSAPAVTSADERLREALAFYADENNWLDGSPGRWEPVGVAAAIDYYGSADTPEFEHDHGEVARAALAGVSAEAPKRERITHGRHCICSACAAEDWTNPHLAPCGMHGSSCPREYAPLGGAGDWVCAEAAPEDEHPIERLRAGSGYPSEPPEGHRRPAPDALRDCYVCGRPQREHAGGAECDTPPPTDARGTDDALSVAGQSREEWRVVDGNNVVCRHSGYSPEWAEGQCRALAARFPDEPWRIERRVGDGEWLPVDTPPPNPYPENWKAPDEPTRYARRGFGIASGAPPVMSNMRAPEPGGDNPAITPPSNPYPFHEPLRVEHHSDEDKRQAWDEGYAAGVVAGRSIPSTGTGWDRGYAAGLAARDTPDGEP